MTPRWHDPSLLVIARQLPVVRCVTDDLHDPSLHDPSLHDPSLLVTARQLPVVR